MSSSSKKQDNVVQIDQVLNSTDTPLDVDLSDASSFSATGASEWKTDIDGNRNSTSSGIHISESKELITRPASDVTVRAGRRNLDRLRENIFQDAHDYQEKRIVHPEMENYEILNAFREIRTKLIQSSKGKNQVVMIVSLRQGMGTTFSAINLAAAFSYEGEKTSLLIDCDQHKNKLEKVFSHNVEYGLTDYLDDNDVNIEKIIHPTGINRMRYIPIGHRKETVAEFFSSEKMRNFIINLKNRYSDRYIIMSTPPLEVTADAAILSEVADKIVVVLPYANVSNQRLKKALRLLPKDKIIGFVINNKTKYV